MADIGRTREVFNFVLRLIPHKKFTFAKVWLYAAKFEIRQKQLTNARKLLVRHILLICFDVHCVIILIINLCFSGHSTRHVS